LARPAALLLVLPLLAATASAEVAAPAAPWDGRHMRSNFANHGVATPRPAIEGLDADGHVAHDTVPHTQVQEQVLSINPLGWQPGAGGRHTTGGGRPFAKGTRFTPPTGATPQRSNAIRAELSHTPRGRATP
jgi:hypothetical protein